MSRGKTTLVAVLVLAACACRGRSAGNEKNADRGGTVNGATAVDTTKDVYGDDAAPKVQVRIYNGQREEIPWEKVPEHQRYIVEYDDKGGYTLRVPIVRMEGSASDKEGRPVPHGAPPGTACNSHWTLIGLNPKHQRHSDRWCNH